MRWVRQDPWTEDSCGQCSIAMLLGISKREAIARVGHELGTETRELTRVLKAGGFEMPARMRRLDSFADIPTPHALLLGYWKQYPHWMAYGAGKVFDPVEGIVKPRGDRLPRVLKVTHFLALTRAATGSRLLATAPNRRARRTS